MTGIADIEAMADGARRAVHAAVADEQGDQPRAKAPRPIRVLVVDDEVEIHDALIDALDECGHPVAAMSAYNGAEALETMRAQAPDVVFLDIRMPVMDGLALRQEMYNDPSLLDVYVVVFTGNRMSKTELQVLMADEYLPKPADLKKICHVLDAVAARLADHNLRRRLRLEATLARLRTLGRDIDEMAADVAEQIRKLEGP